MNILVDLKEGVQVYKSRAQRFMNFIIGSIEKDAANNWTKIDFFFKFIYNVMIGGPNQVEFAYQSSLLVTLVDFFLGPNSPLALPEQN